jgi:hypothetical protein
MNSVLRVHERLLSQLPVRTIQTRREFVDAPFAEPCVRRTGRPRAEEVLQLNRRIKILHAAGHNYEEIQAITGAHSSTIARHLSGNVATLSPEKISQLRQQGAKRR